MEKHYHKELDAIKEQLVQMARKVQEMLSNSIEALVNLDDSKIDAVNQREHEVNLQEIAIDSLCLKFIALYQPAGPDVRLLSVISKINNDLERVGDEAVNITERAKRLIKDPRLEHGDMLPQMQILAKDMLNLSVEALVKNDITNAKEIFKKEDTLDDFNRKITLAVIDQIKRKPEITDLALDLLSISHRFERIGDMAVNIIEDIIFFVTGEDARHPFDKKG